MSKPWIFFGTKVKSLKNILSINGNAEINSTASTNLAFTIGGTDRLSFDSSASTMTGTFPSLGPSGSASLPSFSFSGDPNTGIYSFGADQLGFATGGTSVGNIGSTGAWTFGTTASSLTHTFNGSTASRIEVKRNTATAATGFFEAASGEVNIGSVTSVPLKFYTNNTIYGSLSTSGAWTLGASGGSQTHTINGVVSVIGNTSSLYPTSNDAIFNVSGATATNYSELHLKETSSTEAWIIYRQNVAAGELRFYSSQKSGGATDVGSVTKEGVWTLGVNSGGQGIIRGTATNDSASSGFVGEYVSSTVSSGSALALTTATAKTITSISLTAGDWDIYGHVAFAAEAGLTVQMSMVAVGTTTNSLSGTTRGLSQVAIPIGQSSATDLDLTVSFRVSLSSTTTYYLLAYQEFTVGSPDAFGHIFARRVR